MPDFATAAWAVGIAAWVVLAVYVYSIAGLGSKGRLMRCPETGAVAVVGVEAVTRRAGNAAEIEVRRCGLWPERMNCARGCLARYGETTPGYRVNLDALRPFERQWQSAGKRGANRADPVKTT